LTPPIFFFSDRCDIFRVTFYGHENFKYKIFSKKFAFVSEILKCQKTGTREGKDTNISQAEKMTSEVIEAGKEQRGLKMIFYQMDDGRRPLEVNMTSKTVPEVTEVSIKTTEVTKAVEVTEKTGGLFRSLRIM